MNAFHFCRASKASKPFGSAKLMRCKRKQPSITHPKPRFAPDGLTPPEPTLSPLSPPPQGNSVPMRFTYPRALPVYFFPSLIARGKIPRTRRSLLARTPIAPTSVLTRL